MVILCAKERELGKKEGAPSTRQKVNTFKRRLKRMGLGGKERNWRDAAGCGMVAPVYTRLLPLLKGRGSPAGKKKVKNQNAEGDGVKGSETMRARGRKSWGGNRENLARGRGIRGGGSNRLAKKKVWERTIW